MEGYVPYFPSTSKARTLGLIGRVLAAKKIQDQQEAMLADKRKQQAFENGLEESKLAQGLTIAREGEAGANTREAAADAGALERTKVTVGGGVTQNTQDNYFKAVEQFGVNSPQAQSILASLQQIGGQARPSSVPAGPSADAWPDAPDAQAQRPAYGPGSAAEGDGVPWDRDVITGGLSPQESGFIGTTAGRPPRSVMQQPENPVMRQMAEVGALDEPAQPASASGQPYSVDQLLQLGLPPKTIFEILDKQASARQSNAAAGLSDVKTQLAPQEFAEVVRDNQQRSLDTQRGQNITQRGQDIDYNARVYASDVAKYGHEIAGRLAAARDAETGRHNLATEGGTGKTNARTEITSLRTSRDNSSHLIQQQRAQADEAQKDITYYEGLVKSDRDEGGNRLTTAAQRGAIWDKAVEARARWQRLHGQIVEEVSRFNDYDARYNAAMKAAGEVAPLPAPGPTSVAPPAGLGPLPPTLAAIRAEMHRRGLK